jgi:glycosyltransferase involved in cell wall biosynthesis
MLTSTRTRLLIAAPPRHLSDHPRDGHVSRHQHFLRALETRHELQFVVIANPVHADEVSSEFANRVLGRIQAPGDPATRLERAKVAGRLLIHPRSPYELWESQLLEVARAADPRVVLTLGPWMDKEFRVLHEHFRSIHVFEEDVYRLPDIWSQTRRARAFRRLETMAQARMPGSPEAVVVIADAETRPARQRWPKAEIVTLPYTVSRTEWPLVDAPADGDYVLVVGVLTHQRNAAGLVELLGELERRHRTNIPFRLVSDAGLHPDLDRFVQLPWVDHVPAGTDLVEHYRHARLAVVPAKHATGMKTTILQAWTSGTAVVTYAASAATMGAQNAEAAVSGRDAAEVADLVVEVWGDQAKRHSLSCRGIARVREAFDDVAVNAELLALVAGLHP